MSPGTLSGASPSGQAVWWRTQKCLLECEVSAPVPEVHRLEKYHFLEPHGHAWAAAC